MDFGGLTYQGMAPKPIWQTGLGWQCLSCSRSALQSQAWELNNHFILALDKDLVALESEHSLELAPFFHTAEGQ